MTDVSGAADPFSPGRDIRRILGRHHSSLLGFLKSESLRSIIYLKPILFQPSGEVIIDPCF